MRTKMWPQQFCGFFPIKFSLFISYKDIDYSRIVLSHIFLPL